jgi:hypothetical protein
MVPQSKLSEGIFPKEINDFVRASRKSNAKKSTFHKQYFQAAKTQFQLAKTI